MTIKRVTADQVSKTVQGQYEDDGNNPINPDIGYLIQNHRDAREEIRSFQQALDELYKLLEGQVTAQLYDDQALFPTARRAANILKDMEQRLRTVMSDFTEEVDGLDKYQQEQEEQEPEEQYIYQDL